MQNAKFKLSTTPFSYYPFSRDFCFTQHNSSNTWLCFHLSQKFPFTYSLFLIPFSLFPFPYSLFLIPFSLFPFPYSLFFIPFSLFPFPYSLINSIRHHNQNNRLRHKSRKSNRHHNHDASLHEVLLLMVELH